MRKIRDILRLRLAAGLSIRQIKANTKVSIGAIQQLLAKADALGLTWPLPEAMDDVQLARISHRPVKSRMTVQGQEVNRMRAIESDDSVSMGRLWVRI